MSVKLLNIVNNNYHTAIIGMRFVCHAVCSLGGWKLFLSKLDIDRYTSKLFGTYDIFYNCHNRTRTRLSYPTL